MIAYLFIFHMVHWLFILGQGWLFSNNFCKACQNCLHPSFVIVHKALLLVKAPAIMQHKQRQLGQNKFWHVLPNWMLCSHPWPNMNKQCTKLKKTNNANRQSFVISFFNFEKFGVKPGFLFTQLNQATYSKRKVILTCFTKWLLSSHLLSNMHEQCVIWKRDYYHFLILVLRFFFSSEIWNKIWVSFF